MLLKSIRINKINNLTLIFKSNSKNVPYIEEKSKNPVVKTNINKQKKIDINDDALLCDDKLIKKIIENGGL